MAIALDDFIAPDCRFINIKKGLMVYVYSKLTPEEGAGVFWSGSVCAFFVSSVAEILRYAQRMCSRFYKHMKSFFVLKTKYQERHLKIYIYVFLFEKYVK